MQDYLNELYMNKTGATSGIFYRTTFYVPADDRPEMDWSNYCVIGLIGVIVLLGVVGSIVPKITSTENFPIKIVKCFSFTQNFGKIVAVSKPTEN